MILPFGLLTSSGDDGPLGRIAPARRSAELAERFDAVGGAGDQHDVAFL
jgi:hypothetical protein